MNTSEFGRQYPDTGYSDHSDLDTLASGHGYEYEPIHTSFCPDGVPLEFALLSLLAAFGVAFGVLYVALTMATGRRRRELSGDFLLLDSNIADLIWAGNNSWPMIVYI